MLAIIKLKANDLAYPPQEKDIHDNPYMPADFNGLEWLNKLEAEHGPVYRNEIHWVFQHCSKQYLDSEIWSYATFPHVHVFEFFFSEFLLFNTSWTNSRGTNNARLVHFAPAGFMQNKYGSYGERVGNYGGANRVEAVMNALTNMALYAEDAFEYYRKAYPYPMSLDKDGPAWYRAIKNGNFNPDYIRKNGI
jgi:hypothetical protein